MTNEEWAQSTSAPTMLAGLYLQDPIHFQSFVPTLHQYFLACCWNMKHLIPQKGLRNGIHGAEKWIAGQITDTEYYELERNAEAEAFALECVETYDEIERLKTLIASIDELKETPYDIAHQILCEAAYFTDSAIIYPKLSNAPYVEGLCTSRFLCPKLLRKFLHPQFHCSPHKGSLDLIAKGSHHPPEDG